MLKNYRDDLLVWDWMFGGSHAVSAMKGDVLSKMAEAIENSNTVIICVSRYYRESPNCRAEANYIRNRQQIQTINIIYLMMEDDYTTTSKTPVDGWLGIYLAGELWYPLFNSSNLDGTTELIYSIVSKTGY